MGQATREVLHRCIDRLNRHGKSEKWLMVPGCARLRSRFLFKGCRMGRATCSETFVLQPAYSGVGSIDPFGEAKCERRLVSTGWEPHGDSGSARSRVRASQPAR